MHLYTRLISAYVGAMIGHGAVTGYFYTGSAYGRPQYMALGAVCALFLPINLTRIAIERQMDSHLCKK